MLNPERIKDSLIPKLRLFILLTDERYAEKLTIEDVVEIEKEIDHFFKNIRNKKKLKPRLFNKPINYLYKKIGKKEILKLFVEEIENKKGEHIKLGYKKASFQLSFFYKVKSIIEMKENKTDKINLIKKIFENMCKIIDEKKLIESDESKDKNNEAKKENLIDYKLDFKFTEFGKKLTENDVENAEWIDILILFYSYSQQKMKYVNIYETKDNNNKQNRNDRKGKRKNEKNNSRNKDRI